MAERTTGSMSMLFDVWLVMHATTTLIDEALAATELSGDDFGLYSLLRGYGPTTPSQISRWTGMRPTTVSVGLKRMRGRGHAVETPNPEDGRSYLVGLSDAGLAAHTASAPPFLAAMARLGEELGGPNAERDALRRIDTAFRTVLSLDDRPYDLEGEADDSRWHLTYTGRPLSGAEERQARDYIDYLRTPRT